MLFLFSDVTELDAPTRIAIGSHLEVAKGLEPYGDAGLSVTQLAAALDPDAARREVLATGAAGTVYPLLLHAAQAHRGNESRFMAQLPLIPATPFGLRPSYHQTIRMCLMAPPSTQHSDQPGLYR